MVDNRTLSGQTINAVERFSLYPELITSFIYRLTGGQVRWFLSSDGSVHTFVI